MDLPPRLLPETVHVRGDGDRCDWCREAWPCAAEREAEYERRHQAQVCTCGHQRGMHHRSPIGLDACTVTDFEHGPPWHLCRCGQFRRAVTTP